MQIKRLKICCSLPSGSARTNRIMGFISACRANGISVEVLLTRKLPDPPSLFNVSFVELAPWIQISWLKSILASFILPWHVKRGETVIIFSDFHLLVILASFLRRARVFHERTENPELLMHKNLPARLLSYWYFNRLKYLSGCFVITRALKKWFTGHGVAEEKICIVNMTVDPQRFDSVRDAVGVPPVICYCGSLNTDKDGVDILIRAFQKIAAQHPGTILELLGDWQDGINRSAIEAVIREHAEVADRIHLTGKLPPEDIVRHLCSASVVALARPSSIQADYGFPTKLGEYLLSARPALLTNVGEIGDFLQDGKNAYLVSPDSVDAFAQKLDWILKHPDIAEQVGRLGRETAMKEFNCFIEAEKIFHFISQDIA